MELLIPIGAILLTGTIGYGIIAIQGWITDRRFYRSRHLKELRLAMRQLENSEFFSRTNDVSADEIGKALDKQKIGTVTGTVGYEELEEMGANLDEAEKLIKEARDRRVSEDVI